MIENIILTYVTVLCCHPEIVLIVVSNGRDP